MSPNKYIVNGERVSADEYNKRKYDDLRVRVPKGKNGIISAHAKEIGESINGFINRAINHTMEADKKDGMD